MRGREGVLFLFLVGYLGPFVVCFEVWLLEGDIFRWVYELPGARVGGGEEFVKILGHPFAEFGALF